MSLLTTHAELDELGAGRFRQTLHLKPYAYREGGALKRIVSDWGDGDLGHLVTKAPMMVSAAGDGKYRIYPTREFDRYIELSQPMVKPAGSWVGAGFGNPTRSGNTVTFTQAQGKATLALTMGGHFLKLDIELLGGYVPSNNQFAWPITLQGLTRSGNTLFADGVPVCSFRAPTVYDADNPLDVRPIAFQFGAINGQTGVLFTLPNLAGMSRPVVDPTLALQPDATDGKDTVITSDAGTSPNRNHGIGIYFSPGEDNTGAYLARGLIQFDLSAIPGGATIDAATLSLFESNIDRNTNDRIFRCLRMLQAWVEGTGDNSLVVSGATWNTYDGTNAWQTAGAAGANDREATDIGSANVLAALAANAEQQWSLTPSAVQEWVDGVLTNNGLLIQADTEANDRHLFWSSDNATAAYRPKLVIVYTLAVPSSTGSFISVLRHRG